ncbi:ABC transporter permease [Streptomyces adelaidensis]|uniref:ABC transporter permease n=1 Tax=Streptomyces adelaidensis TaxID=2796465 RepID=UPI00190309E7|nr:ABC transporter permease [Streptomyces adelaidensis]
MTTATTDTAGRTSARPTYKVTLLGVLRSEWSKFWSLRSSWITLGLAQAMVIVIGTLACAAYSPGSGGENGPPIGDSALGLALTGVTLAALAVGVLGVLVAAGEYSTGMIRSTLAAVPKRLPVLWSKALVYGVVGTAAATIAVLGAFQLGGLTLMDTDIALGFGDDGVPRALFGAGVYLGLVGMWGVALGALVRSTAGGIAVLAGLLLIVPGLASLLPDSLADNITPYLPSNAGSAMYALEQSSDLLSPGAGLVALVGCVAVTLAGAAYRLARTDA